MSRIGKLPITVPSGVTASIDGQQVRVKGPRGEASIVLVDEVVSKMSDDGITVSMVNDTRHARSMWGLSRTLVSNIVVGVSEGFTKTLEINGVGYRAQIQGNTLQLLLGFSHDVNYPIPDDVKIECPKPTEIIVSGNDKQRVGQIAAEIRQYRPPEPFKGKGVKYQGEYIFRKEGKKK